jgi:type I site-specific restriction endonuclease
MRHGPTLVAILVTHDAVDDVEETTGDGGPLARFNKHRDKFELATSAKHQRGQFEDGGLVIVDVSFDGFLTGKSPTSNQLEFMNMVIDHLTERGAMEPKLLYESPFTDIDPLGIAGLFRQAEVEQVISILDEVRRRAAA